MSRFVLVVLALQTGCGDREAEPSTAESPPLADSSWSQIVWAQLDTLAVLGSGQPSSGPLFFRVSDAVLDNAHNSVFLVNGGDGELVRYDLGDGRISRIGRSGVGPGEFGRPLWMEPYGPDSLLVYDRELNRFSVFSRSGSFGRMFRVAGTGLAGKQAAAMTRMDSATWVAFSSGLPQLLLIPETPFGTKARDTLIAVAMTDDGHILDTIARVPHGLWELLPDSTSFNIRRDEDAGGAIVASGGGRLFVGGFGESLELFAYLFNGGPEAPSRHPVVLPGVPQHGVREVFASREGSLWLTSNVSAGDSTAFHVFEEYLDIWRPTGRLTFPGAVRILDAVQDRALFSHRDELGQETLIVARAYSKM